MWKRTLLLALLSLTVLVSSPQDSGCTTWERQNCKVSADSLVAAIDRGDTVKLEGCEVFGTLKKSGTADGRDTVRSPITVYFSTFRDTVSFSSCVFMCEIDFQGTSFHNQVIFSGITFEKHVYFLLCDFIEQTYFWGCTFKKRACFGPSFFKARASFVADTVLESTDFQQARFEQWATFIDVLFAGEASFLGTEFEHTVSFRRSTFADRVNLTSMRFKEIDILWKQIKHDLVCDVYTAYDLMRSFDEKRMLDDADGAYMFLKEQERIRKPWYERYPEFWLIQQTCGYGVRPLRALATSGLVIALFALFYYFITIRESKRALQAGLKRICLKAYNALYFSVNTFLVGAPVDWAPEDTEFSGRHYLFRILQTTERALGWILLVLFVVTLSRKFIR